MSYKTGDYAKYGRKHHLKNNAVRVVDAVERSERRKRAIRAWISALKQGPCLDCGGTFPSVCMDFDHRDGGEKGFTISHKGSIVSRARLLAEIAKCDVVCSNCHRIRTASRGTRKDAAMLCKQGG